MYLPPAMHGRFPAVLQAPVRMKGPKKIDARYDVTQIGNRNVAGGLDFYSINREIAMGQEMSRELESQVRLVSDPMVTEYINRLGQRLVRNSDAQVPFTIKVIDDDEINAFALPGGFFYVNTGMIMATDNEAQLAGVMAHEIAHVAARHATKNESKQNLMDMMSIPLLFFGGPAAMIVRQAVNLAIPMGYLKFSRDAEREADLLGLEYDYSTGYDPQEYVQLFERLKATEKKKHNLVEKAFATHPMTTDRIKRAEEEIQKYLPAREDYIVDTSEFEAVRKRVMELGDRQKVDMGRMTPVLVRRDKESTQDQPAQQEPRP